MGLVGVVAETFGRWSHIFAGQSFRVIEGGVYPISCFLCIIFPILVKLLLAHYETSIISNQIAIFNILIDMFGIGGMVDSVVVVTGCGTFFVGFHRLHDFWV